MKRLSLVLLGAVVLTLVSNVPAQGQIVFPIGPFTGTRSDDFSNDGPGGAGGHQTVVIFNGLTTVNNTTPGGALKIEFSSSLNGDLVTPRSAPLMFGQIGISQWIFNSPVTQLGGYWQNNSRFDDATVQFFDANSNLLASLNATDPHGTSNWTWNGWQSTVPISSITVTGNDIGFLNGFIWWDDFQVTFSVPEPKVYLLLGSAALLIGGFWFYQRRKMLRRTEGEA
jgi:hypothetical protein